MLFSHFDDSSDPAHQEDFAVGGLIGGEKQWADFHVPWAVATVNLTEPFRSTDCECNHGQFKTWSKPDCNALMGRLVSIVLERQLHGYASVVPIADYNAVFPGCGEYDPYYLAVRHTIINLANLGLKVRGYDILGGMECWFEESNATSGSTLKIYKDLKTWEGGRGLKGVHFGDKTIRPLQAADLVAREAFKYFKNRGTIKARIPVDRMRDVLNFCVWGRDALEYLRDYGGPEDVELLTSWERWGGLGRPEPPQLLSLWKDF